MSEQIFNTRIVHKHDIEANWNKATNFIPKQGELIVYDVDDNYDYQRLKIGDGITYVKDLAFMSDIILEDNVIMGTTSQLTPSEVIEAVSNKKRVILGHTYSDFILVFDNLTCTIIGGIPTVMATIFSPQDSLFILTLIGTIQDEWQLLSYEVPTTDDIPTGALAWKNTISKSELDTSIQTSLEQINLKVDKVAGKGLSTNDYTTAEKDKLAGIEAGAEVNQNSFGSFSTDRTNYKEALSPKSSIDFVAGGGINIASGGGKEADYEISIINTGVYSVSTGTVKGAISVHTQGGITSVPVNGLGSAAYTNTNAYDAAGAANTAETNANSYTDTKLANLITPDDIDTICGQTISYASEVLL